MTRSDRLKRLAVPLVAFTLGLVVLGVAAVLTLAPSRGPAASAVGGPFTLVDQDGRTVSERDFAGKPFLVFFGFTRCPDICPTKLFELSEVLRATGDKGRRLRALFITVDPERDTPDHLKHYMPLFHPRLIGLTGDAAAIEAAVRAYRVYFEKVERANSADYTVDHSGFIYLIGRNGEYLGFFPPGTSAERLADAIRPSVTRRP